MFSVVLDTCVLWPQYLRDTLLRLGAAGLYRPLWSAEIMDELHRNVSLRTGNEEATARMIANMQRAFPSAEVTGFTPLVDVMTNHPKDRHVLAAAVRAKAGAIVTENVNDFPAASRDGYGIGLLRPDQFLLDQIDLAPGTVMAVLRRQVAAYGQPHMDVYGLADRLARSGCAGAADQIRLHADTAV